VIEGRVGNVVTVLVPQGSRANNLAALSEVTSIRLPRISSAPTKAEPKKEEPKEEKKENLVLFAQGKSEPAAVDPLKSTHLTNCAANTLARAFALSCSIAASPAGKHSRSRRMGDRRASQSR
jgi:hypothetical protein